MSERQSVIFDFDDTLVDTSAVYDQSVTILLYALKLAPDRLKISQN